MMAPQDFLPQIAQWVGTLDETFPGAQVKPYFAHWEVVHLLSLALLGGSSILLNLRLMGYGLTDAPPSEVRRGVAPWLHLGVFGIIFTGLLIGASNPDRLYTSEAFTAKMLCLAAALVLTYGVSLPTARSNGRLGPVAMIAGLVGVAIWGLGLAVFGTGKLINPGLWHVVTAAALVGLFVTRGLTRIIYLVGMGGLIIAQYVNTHIIIKPDDYARLDPTNKIYFGVFLAWILGAVLVQVITAGRGATGGPATRLFAFAALLVWVTTAAAGRWIAFA